MKKNKLIILGLVLFCLNSEAGDSIGPNSLAIGNASQSLGSSSYAIGVQAISRRNFSYAIGFDTRSEGVASYAIGSDAQSRGEASYAIGSGAISRLNYSYAIGNDAQSQGDSSYAIGNASQSLGNYSYAIGIKAQSQGYYSYAIGGEANSKSLTSISLGSFSEDKVEESINTKGNIKYNNETVNGVNFQFYQGKSENKTLKKLSSTYSIVGYDENKFSVLSIGNENYNRRIQNLAPGLIGPKSTDAINGSQLYSVIDVLTKTSVNFAGLAGDKHNETIKVKDLGFEFNNGLKAKKVTRDGKEFIVVGLDTTNDGNNTSLGGRGDKGPQGDKGLKGETGNKGPQGDKGLKGETGDKGPQGDRGLKGETGDKGPQGDRGLKGESGDKGPQGDKGLKGESGDKGPQGDRGLKGETGDKGPQGDKGLKGETGDKGPKGYPGDSGFKSQDGKLILEKSQTISNVSDGLAPMDVVNKRQLDKVREDLSSRVDIATSGVANALSVASLPQVNSTSGERFNIGVGIGYGMYGGEHSMALGVSGIVGISKGNLMYKLNGSLNSKLKFGLGIGLGYQFGFGSSVNSDSEIEILKKKNERNEARIDELMRIIENMKK